MKRSQTHVRPNHCPNCDALLDAATNVENGHRPHAGAVTICLYCGHLMAFADDMTFRDLTDSEMHEIAGDKRILLASRISQEFLKHQKENPLAIAALRKESNADKGRTSRADRRRDRSTKSR